MTMTRKQIEWLERRLLEERERALRVLRVLEWEEAVPQRESSGELSRLPSHMADQGSNTEEQEKDFLVLDAESERLAQIHEALQLLREDPARFERCDRCDHAIGVERLDLIPWTRLCAACAREEE